MSDRSNKDRRTLARAAVVTTAGHAREGVAADTPYKARSVICCAM